MNFDPKEFVRSAARNKSREITTEELVQWAYDCGRLSAHMEQSEKRNGKPVPCIEHEFMPYFVENGKTQ